MQPTSWSRPEPCEVLVSDQWTKQYISHRLDGKLSLADPTRNGLAHRIKEQEREE